MHDNIILLCIVQVPSQIKASGIPEAFKWFEISALGCPMNDLRLPRREIQLRFCSLCLLEISEHYGFYGRHCRRIKNLRFLRWIVIGIR
jgi:hypothetical protein